MEKGIDRPDGGISGSKGGTPPFHPSPIPSTAPPSAPPQKQIPSSNPLSAAERGPNLLFIIADDYTDLDMEVHGGQAKPPHLDTLANTRKASARKMAKKNKCS